MIWVIFIYFLRTWEVFRSPFQAFAPQWDLNNQQRKFSWRRQIIVVTMITTLILGWRCIFACFMQEHKSKLVWLEIETRRMPNRMIELYSSIYRDCTHSGLMIIIWNDPATVDESKTRNVEAKPMTSDSSIQQYDFWIEACIQSWLNFMTFFLWKCKVQIWATLPFFWTFSDKNIPICRFATKAQQIQSFMKRSRFSLEDCMFPFSSIWIPCPDNSIVRSQQTFQKSHFPEKFS